MLTPLATWAQSDDQQQDTTKIFLSAEASALVSHDEVLIQFRVETRGKYSQALRESVDRMSNNIIRALSREDGLSITTTSRRTDPIYGNGNHGHERNGWIVSQTSQVTSHKLDTVAKWLEAIEAEGALLQGLHFRISDDLRQRTENTLRLQAITQFQQQAADVAKIMSASAYQVNQLQTSVFNPEPMLQSRAVAPMMMRAADNMPALEAGESRIRVGVSGEIEIRKSEFPVSQSK